MKIMKLQFIAALSLCNLALAQPAPTMPDFEEVDKDMDGYLNMEEAKVVFPTLTIEDANMDGFVGKSEAEHALPGLVYGNDTHEDDVEFIGPIEYVMFAEQYLLTARDYLED